MKRLNEDYSEVYAEIKRAGRPSMLQELRHIDELRQLEERMQQLSEKVDSLLSTVTLAREFISIKRGA